MRSHAKVLMAIGAQLALLAFASTASGAEDCPNASVRAQQGSAYLPECRAYEQVTPVQKQGGEFIDQSAGFKKYLVDAAPDGNSVAFEARASLMESAAGLQITTYLANRIGSAWSDRSIDAPARGAAGEEIGVKMLSDDLTKTLSAGPGPPLAAGAGDEGFNLYFRDLAGEDYRTVSLNPLEPDASSKLQFAGSQTLSHVAFESDERNLLAAPPFVNNVYDWHDGTLDLVGILPDGSVAPGGAILGGAPSLFGETSAFNAVSNDGSAIFFTAPEDGQIYVRLNGVQTKAVSASQKSGPASVLAGGTYWAASGDGGKAIFTSSDQLLDEDADSEADLYMFNTATGTLERLTSGASVYQVLGVADDLSYIYFMALGQSLAEGAKEGEPEVYVWHNGQIDLVSTWGGLAGSGGLGATESVARVSQDGSAFAFMSTDRLTEYDNQGTYQAYLYDAVTKKLACASCPTAGTAPTGASMPWGKTKGTSDADMTTYQTSLSANGDRLFFTTPQQLDPRDVNQVDDVYEYVSGSARLISSGKGRVPSVFQDASASGADVFFSTGARLAPSDTDDRLDLYDARVGGGAEVVPVRHCDGEDCQGAASTAPVVSTPATNAISGAGKVVRKQKSRHKHRRVHRHKKAPNKHQHRKAGQGR